MESATLPDSPDLAQDDTTCATQLLVAVAALFVFLQANLTG